MYQDERGTIRDIEVGKDYSVTHITFAKGAVRGNHLHKKTQQTDIVLEGELEVAVGNVRFIKRKGDFVHIEPGEPHAYKALKKSAILSTCLGKRIGDNYAKDTFKTKHPLI
jgi:quercetin dioxygenase-like cupin family protein